MRWAALFFLACGGDQSFVVDPPDPIIIEPNPVALDGFTQTMQPDFVDLLLTLDRSCSMDSFDEGVSGLMLDLAHDFQDSSIDFNMYLSNCGQEDHADIIGPLTEASDDIDFQLALTGLGNSGINEQCFETIFTHYYAGRIALGRPAFAIFVSDEDEQSIYSTAQFAQFMDEKTPLWDAASYVAQDEDCGDLGDKYNALSDLLARPRMDLCAPFESPLIASPIFSPPKSELILQHEPIESTIEIYFDWISVQVDYTVAGSVLTFVQPPPEGVSVAVVYEYEPKE